jgi:SAM-dependent methyltransferase
MAAVRRADADRDDWNRHWAHFGEAASDNPAVSYRRRLIADLLGPLGAGDRILDVGSGQGELAIMLKLANPAADVRGIEYAAEGVRRSQDNAAQTAASVRFRQRDLLVPSDILDGDRHWASAAVCSEVIEHVDDPELLLKHASAYFAPGCRLIVTVPGGPRSAFDRHIGHRQHFTEKGLRALLEDAGISVERVYRAGFPFFNLYKVAVVVRSRQLIREFDAAASESGPSRLANALLQVFDKAFRWNFRSSPFGWQLLAVGRFGQPEQQPEGGQ